MIVTIHQPQYLPWLGYFDKAASADVFILLDNVQFKKNEWQNRNRIRTPQGPQWLTVPVIHDFGQKINEVKINNKIDWRADHLKALKLNYAKAPHFARYIGFFENIFKCEWGILSDLNIFFVRELMQLLGIKSQVVVSSQFDTTDESTQRLIDLCKKFRARQYLSGKDGSKYMDLTKFEEQGIKVDFQDYHHPEYPQRWAEKTGEKFISHLSVVDLLFNCGEESLRVLHKKAEVV